MAKIHAVRASEFDSWVDERGATVLDVRTPGEWAAGTVPGSELVSLQELPAAVHLLERTRPVLVVCRSGARSKQAARFLVRQGFTTVGNLVGGLRSIGKAA